MMTSLAEARVIGIELDDDKPGTGGRKACGRGSSSVHDPIV